MTEPSFAGRRLHFVGIGGAGMSGLALVARALGAEVGGSDRAESSYTERLRAAGIEPTLGHSAANVPEGAELVVSTAIAEDNPELVRARDEGLRVLHRADLLAELTRLKRSIVISGTHGKTTTAAMTAHVLLRCGREPAYLVGGELRAAKANAAWGAGEWLVAEADESDRSFLKLDRDVAVVTNVELDHHATYRSPRELWGAFAQFVKPATTVIAWEGARWGPPPVAGLYGARPDERSAMRYGIEEGELAAQDVELLPLGSRFTVDGVRARLRVPGEHNVLNALAALAACREAGVPLAEAAPALEDFTGAARRFEEHGATTGGARIFDDYAHHPTEVRATLEAARTLEPHRLVACFQPHLYSRTRELAREFGQALALADLVVVLDVYPARERAEDYPGVSGLTVARTAAEAAAGRPVWWLPGMDDAERMLRERLREGDVLLTLGAGDVVRLAERLSDGAQA